MRIEYDVPTENWEQIEGPVPTLEPANGEVRIYLTNTEMVLELSAPGYRRTAVFMSVEEANEYAQMEWEVAGRLLGIVD